jgi:hypothetical protein
VRFRIPEVKKRKLIVHDMYDKKIINEYIVFLLLIDVE